jgi:hypothetical protein
MAADLKFKHPFTCIVSVPTGSGKSSFNLRFLQNLDSLCTEPNFGGEIIWCYSEKSAVPERELAALYKEVRFHERIPQN